MDERSATEIDKFRPALSSIELDHNFDVDLVSTNLFCYQSTPQMLIVPTTFMCHVSLISFRQLNHHRDYGSHSRLSVSRPPNFLRDMRGLSNLSSLSASLRYTPSLNLVGDMVSKLIVEPTTDLLFTHKRSGQGRQQLLGKAYMLGSLGLSWVIISNSIVTGNIFGAEEIVAVSLYLPEISK